MTRTNLQPLLLSDSSSASVSPGENDRRPQMPEPLPVRLVTIEDAHFFVIAGQEVELDLFYVALLGFEKEQNESAIIYRADNFRLICDVKEPSAGSGLLIPTAILRDAQDPDRIWQDAALRNTSESTSPMNAPLNKPIFNRPNMRALGIEVLVLRATRQKLIDAEIKHEWRQGLHPGKQSLLLQDPAGNWIELTGRSDFR